MTSIHVDIIDHVYMRIDGPPDILMELSEHFAFMSKAAPFHPAYKKFVNGKRLWDGKIRLFKLTDRLLYVGLLPRLISYCEKNQYDLEILNYRHDTVTEEIVDQFIQELNLPSHITPHDYQIMALKKAILWGRRLILSPTSSGKSLIMYMLSQYYREYRGLLIVPFNILRGQLPVEFEQYGGNPDDIHIVKNGDFETNKPLTVANWQSIVDLPQEWFDQFGYVMGDEAHRFSADSLVKIMGRTVNARYKFGFTGTLEEAKADRMVLEGLFGGVSNMTTTKKLMDRGIVASGQIEFVILKHPPHVIEELKAHMKKAVDAAKEKNKNKKNNTFGAVRYAAEIDFLTNLEYRNRFIVKIANKVDGNVIIFFHRREHGKALLDQIVQITDRKVHMINGSTDDDVREEIRNIVDKSDNDILLGSSGTSATGMSVKRLHAGIMAHGWKAKVVNLQTIGRVLRLGEGKETFTMFDIVDDFSCEGFTNYGLKHAGVRYNTYLKEHFNVNITKIDLE